MSRVGVLDSGVGGLTILDAVAERLPRTDLFFASDNRNYPYGTKPEAEVVRCTLDVGGKFVERYALDVVVIACNTASTVALPALRELLPVQVIGVVPAVKPAAERTRSGTIGLLATPGTVERAYTDELIREFAARCEVVKHGTRVLVDAAEAKLRGERVDPGAVEAEVTALFERSPQRAPIDTVVLGCTHFPLLLEELREAAPWAVDWIDSGDAIAQRVETLIGERPPTVDPPERRAAFTVVDADNDRLMEALGRHGIDGFEIL